MLCTRVRGIAAPSVTGPTAYHPDRPARMAELIAERWESCPVAEPYPARRAGPADGSRRQCAASRPDAGAERLARRDIAATPIGDLRRAGGSAGTCEVLGRSHSVRPVPRACRYRPMTRSEGCQLRGPRQRTHKPVTHRLTGPGNGPD